MYVCGEMMRMKVLTFTVFPNKQIKMDSFEGSGEETSPETATTITTSKGGFRGGEVGWYIPIFPQVAKWDEPLQSKEERRRGDRG